MLSGKTVGQGFESLQVHQVELSFGPAWFLTAFEYGEWRGLSPITGKNNGFSVNFGPVAQTAAPKAMVAFA